MFQMKPKREKKHLAKKILDADSDPKTLYLIPDYSVPNSVLKLLL